ncbi:diacylglycerol kinase [Pseudoalteromonas sp. SSDWG2]|uniref:diacylglycerol kinase n=1 Tax=Pseudoalteromonas sp. SSDWG2 TaxID=3139391 RepID=UPI003BAAE8E2
MLLALILFPLSFIVAKGMLHWAALISVLLLVLIVELVKSAIQALSGGYRQQLLCHY